MMFFQQGTLFSLPSCQTPFAPAGFDFLSDGFREFLLRFFAIRIKKSIEQVVSVFTTKIGTGFSGNSFEEVVLAGNRSPPP